MLLYAVTVLVVNSCVLAASVLLDWDLLRGQPAAFASLFGELVVVPTAAAMLAAEIVNRVGQRRMFDPRVNARAPCVAAGFFSALVGIGCTAFALVPLRNHVHDAVVAGGCAFIASAAVALCATRRRAGVCVQCGYDLSGSVSCRCSECGSFHTA